MLNLKSMSPNDKPSTIQMADLTRLVREGSECPAYNLQVVTYQLSDGTWVAFEQAHEGDGVSREDPRSGM